MQEQVNRLNELLNQSIKNLLKGKKEIEMAFSGGLDSCVLAKMLLNQKIKVNAYVSGVKNCKDIKQAKKAAEELGLNLRVIELSGEEIEESIGIQGKIIKKVYDKIELKGKEKNDNLTPNAIPISYNLPLYFVAKNAKGKEIIVSQGPDEMLGGYTRHINLSKEQALIEMENNTQDFLKYGINQNLETAKYWKKDFLMPYLDQEIIDFCLNLPYELRINQDIRKYILRQLAINLGISKELAFNNKRAAQYGSGIIDMMKKIAKKKGHHISVIVREKIEK